MRLWSWWNQTTGQPRSLAPNDASKLTVNVSFDCAAPLYPMLNWANTVIGGSYALHQYEALANGAPPAWNPNDIDVFIGTRTFEQFQAEVEKVCEGVNGTIIRVNDFTKGHPDDQRGSPADINEGRGGTRGRDEKFREAVRGSISVTVPDVCLPVQFINMQTDGVQRVEDILETTTDVPSCVQYSVKVETKIPRDAAEADALRQSPAHHPAHTRMTKMFYVPQKDVHTLHTKKVPKGDICPSRLEKYTERGYEFV